VNGLNRTMMNCFNCFEYLLSQSHGRAALAEAYDQVLTRVLAGLPWSAGRIAHRRVLWSDGRVARRTDQVTFSQPGLHIWGVEQRPLYLGKTEASFSSRFKRYIWEKRSQCNLARDFETLLIRNGIAGFPDEIRTWYAKYYSGSVRLDGAARFAKEGIGKVWFALMPGGAAEQIDSLEKALIPIAREWNLRNGMAPLLNVQH
jgi:hypothetical protein